ncbi:MAG: hypothetical protein ACLFUU_06425 [Desulfobacteraceae bacterium]
MYIGEVISTLIGGLAVLLLVGGLLALFLYLLPTLRDWGERAVSPREAPEGSEPLSPPLISAKEEAPPIAPRTVAWDQKGPADSIDPKMVAAVGLALSIHLESMSGMEATLTPVPRSDSPWALAGRLQAMNARLTFRKR